MFTFNTDEPCPKTEAQERHLANNRAYVVARALDLAALNSNADGLRDAVLTKIKRNIEPFERLIQNVAISGACAHVPVDLIGLIQGAFLEFFEEQAEQEILKEEGLL